MAVEPLTSTPFVCPSIGALEPVPLVGNRALNARQLGITSPAITAVPAVEHPTGRLGGPDRPWTPPRLNRNYCSGSAGRLFRFRNYRQRAVIARPTETNAPVQVGHPNCASPVYPDAHS